MSQPLFVGIDVSKSQLDIAINQIDELLDFCSVPHTEEGVSALIQKFRKALPRLIVVECSGAWNVPWLRSWPRHNYRS